MKRIIYVLFVLQKESAATMSAQEREVFIAYCHKMTIFAVKFNALWHKFQ